VRSAHRHYADLDRRAADAAWNSFPLIGDLKLDERKEFISTILDFFRLEYAIHSENYLTLSKIKEYEKHFRELLRAPWTLDRNEELREPFFIRYDHSTSRHGFPPRAWGRPAPWENSSSSMSARTTLTTDIDLKGPNYRLHRALDDHARTGRLTSSRRSPVTQKMKRCLSIACVWKRSSGKSAMARR
jgi:hypothetical protein